MPCIEFYSSCMEGLAHCQGGPLLNNLLTEAVLVISYKSFKDQGLIYHPSESGISMNQSISLQTEASILC